jgi:hypothetical protein
MCCGATQWLARRPLLDLPDPNKTLVPNAKNFIYDAYFFSSTIGAAQVLEFDVSQYFGGKSLIYGSQCRIAGGHAWDIWDNVNRHWCERRYSLQSRKQCWNHVIVHFQRTSDNKVLYQSITLNGVTRDINRTFPPIYGPSPIGLASRSISKWTGTRRKRLFGQGGQAELHVW